MQSLVSWSFTVALLTACGAGQQQPMPGAAPLAPAPELPPTASLPAAVASYDARLEKLGDLDFEQLVRASSLKRAKDRPPRFDPRSSHYFLRARETLEMTGAELARFDERGFVAVDHQRDFSMGSAYFAIYTRDLPVLVTTDSVLHAWHRSFDNALMDLETMALHPAIDDVLRRAHEHLREHREGAQREEARQAFDDVDLYVTIARNLLAGAGAELGTDAKANDRSGWRPVAPDVWDGRLLVRSISGQDAQAERILWHVARLKLQIDPETELFGERRAVDFSQFTPRGHYTRSTPLKRYFRAMMWLGRADTALDLERPRQRRAAALLSRLIADSGGMPDLAAVRSAVDYLIGVGTSSSPEALWASLPRDGRLLADDAAVAIAVDELARDGRGGQQLIRSQTLKSDPHSPVKATPPPLFQVFGQRFTLDGFTLSKVVFDEIFENGRKVERYMPTGLDVAAALGNDEATYLLQDELERYGYGENLLAAREMIGALEPDDWGQSVYSRWLSVLRELHAVPASGAFPDVMRTQAWQRKQLQTQLASWSQLRHDTILYAKQSYTAFAECEYPKGYVEPYPRFYAQLGEMARQMAEVVTRVPMVGGEEAERRHRGSRRNGIAVHFRRFADTMAKLEALARKELASRPFTTAETDFLKRTIDIRGGGSGAPSYTGWYPSLLYGETPETFKPVVSDVHTDPNNGQVLQVATGRTELLVAAIDNAGDRAVYVGPVYSYYEFTQPASARMTDELWAKRVSSGDTPPRPSWTETFRTPGKLRSFRPH
ncbi:MAG: DUF3160 domain-containing protein [Myxococcales bacterium]|nr:DUF3160 domain-containing protein [Myxococcales bacterium]